ncbi:MAG: alpha-L-rhamnosidase, partial [Spirochaetia bacterium]|nr:alpha-L-rhamnosidase [Spirochaetia bacterium]
MTYISKLLVNYLDHITGITAPPQFSWVIESPFRNSSQTKYQIQITTDQSFSSILVDTQWQKSNQSSHVVLEEFIPQQGVLYYVRVRVGLSCDDNIQIETPYSQSSTILGGLHDPDQLKGHFITAEQECDIPLSKGTYLRKEFTLQKQVASAVIYSTAQGMYHLHMNGRRVSSDELAPGWSSYDRRLLYQSYVVTDLISQGKNVLAAHLGAGWYKGTLSFLHIHNFYGPYASLSLLLEITYSDGSKEQFYTDETWKGDYSPIIESELYDGEIYDANLEQELFDTPLFDDSSWRFAKKVNCTSERIEAQTGSTVTWQERVSPKLAFFTPKGERVIDFGQNMSAHVEIRGQGKAGDKIILTCFEVLDKDGNVYTDNLRKAKQRITYILKDDRPFVY